MNKSFKIYPLIVFVAILAAINVIYYLAPIPKVTASPWIAYGFTMFSVLFTCGVLYFSFFKSEPVKSKAYGFPVFRCAQIYMIFQVIFFAVVCLFSTTIPEWITLIVCILALIFALIGVLSAETARTIINNQEQRDAVATSQNTYFRLDAAAILNKCTDPAVRPELEKLADDIRYSDPVSTPALNDVESYIYNQMRVLDAQVNSGSETALTLIADIRRAIADRNQRCKMLKR